MFHLVNKYGNAHKYAETEAERDRLLDLGYTLVEDKEPEFDLDKMTVDQLKAFAKGKDISLEDCKNKAEMLEKIKSAIAN